MVANIKGLQGAGRTTQRTLPLLLMAFLITGYITVLSPQDMVQDLIGPDSGWQGILLGTLVGLILPGGPYVIFPLVAVLYQNGAGVAPIVTIITSWSLLSLLSTSFGLTFMGWRFVVLRWGMALTVPILAGLVVQVLFG